jgi:hypothetical protein
MTKTSVNSGNAFETRWTNEQDSYLYILLFKQNLLLGHLSHFKLCKSWLVKPFSLCLCSCWQSRLSDKSQLCWPAQGLLLSQGQGWQWVRHQRPDCSAGKHDLTSWLTWITRDVRIHQCPINSKLWTTTLVEGVQCSECSGQSCLWEDVPVDGHPN